MILSDSSIIEELHRGNIVIEPFNSGSLNPNTYDLRLSNTLARYENCILDSRKQNQIEQFEIEETGFKLMPNTLYLASTLERVGMYNDICGTLMGKSTLGRLGIDIHISAGFLDTGFEGNIVLEIRVVQQLIIYPFMKIAQVKFERVEGEIKVPYNKNPNSKYNNQKGIVGSLYSANTF